MIYASAPHLALFNFAAVNWWAILVATVAAFALGGLWYGPLFGKAWLAALGKTEAELAPSPAPFAISAGTSFVTSVLMALLMAMLGFVGLIPGLLFGLVVGIGFIATSMASDAAFCRWGWRLWAILAGYRVAYAMLMGGIIGIWPA